MKPSLRQAWCSRRGCDAGAKIGPDCPAAMLACVACGAPLVFTPPSGAEPFPKEITNGEKYGPAMKVESQDEADAYFERCVAHMMTHGHSREEAERIERSNLGYWAGYYEDETRTRVERLFRCAHPIFGEALRPTSANVNGGRRS